MKVSVRPDDEGGLLYGLLLAAQRDCAVYLNGIKQDGVVSADEEGREVVRYVYHANYTPKITSMGAFVTETVYGKVRIEIERR